MSYKPDCNVLSSLKLSSTTDNWRVDIIYIFLMAVKLQLLHGTNLKKKKKICVRTRATRERVLRIDQHSMQEDYLLIGIHSLPSSREFNLTRLVGNNILYSTLVAHRCTSVKNNPRRL